MGLPLHPELETAKGRALEFMEKQLSALFSGADEFLLSAGAKPEEQAAGFEAAALLRAKKEALCSAFVREFEAAFFKNLGVSPVTQAPANVGLAALKLVDEGEMEETLAVTNSARRAGKVCAEGMFALAQRFNELVSDAQFSDENLPLAPQVMGDAFRHALGAVAGDAAAAVKLAILRLFDKHVMQCLGELYDSLNDALAQAGVLPEIRVKVRKQPDSGQSARPAPVNNIPGNDGLEEVVGEPVARPPVPAAPGAELASPPSAASSAPLSDSAAAASSGVPPIGDGNAPPAPASTAAPQANVAVDQGTLSALTALLAQQRSQLAAATAAASPPPAALGEALAAGAAIPPAEATRQLVGSVSVLQQTMQNMAQLGAIATEGGSLASALTRVLKEQQQSAPLTSMDAGTIDILGLMFEVILDDSNIPGSLRALISKLQLPYLKVALLDRSFFDDAQHPARRLLNQLGQAGLGWREVEDPQQDPFYRKVSEVVEVIGEKFDDDVGLFQVLLNDFEAFLSEEDAYGAAKEILIERIKVDVQELVRGKLGKEKLPGCARDLIGGPWRDLLEQIHARKGTDSEEWKQAVSVLDALIWSLQPKADAESKSRLAKMLPKLLKSLRSGLDAVGYDPDKSDELLRALQPLHMATLYGKPASSAEPAPAPAGPEQNSEEDEAAAAARARREEAVLAVKSLVAGDWVEFRPEEDKSLRGKLIWHSEILDDYTFVSRMYKVVAERNSAQLISEFLSGGARRLENVPLIDRALDAVMRRLRGA